MRVFITGGTGLIGTRLVQRLAQRGDAAVVLSRRPESARQQLGARCMVVAGDPTEAGDWMYAVHDCDAVVNLAGEGIFNQRWSKAVKEALVSSRLKSTDNVVAALARQPGTAAGQPKALVSASAIGYYGPHGAEELGEDSPPGSDFLARLCIDWEKSAQAATAHGVRLAIVRIGIVLARDGGALAKMLTPFRLFVGGPVGSGRQYMSWVHIDDLVGLMLFALDRPEADGVYNGTAPQPVTNRDFSSTLGKVLHRPSLLPAPKLALRVMLGEAAEIVTEGQRVLPRRALAQGHVFRFPELEAALRDVLAR